MQKYKPKRIYRSVLYKTKINNALILNNDYNFFIIALDNKLLTRRNIEASRITISRSIRKRRFVRINERKRVKMKGILKINVVFNTPITKKASKSRMGKGKGAIKEYKSFVHYGDVLFMLKNVDINHALRLISKISHKLGMSIGLCKNK